MGEPFCPSPPPGGAPLSGDTRTKYTDAPRGTNISLEGNATCTAQSTLCTQTPYTLRNEQEAVNLSFSLQRGYPASLVCLQAPPGLRVQKGLQFNGDKFNSPHKNKSRQISKNLPFPVPDDSKLTEGLSKTEQAEAEPSSLHWSSTKPHQGSPAP